MHRFVSPTHPNNPDIPESLEDVFSKIVRNINSRMPAAELQDCLDELLPLASHGRTERVGLLVKAILKAETKVISQMLQKMGRYQKLISAQATDLETKIAVVKAVLEFWENSPTLSVLLMQKFLNAGIVDVTSVVHFIFSKDNTHRLVRSYMFEILTDTLNMVVTRTAKHQKELTAANKDLEAKEHLEDCPEKAIALDKAQRSKDLYDKAMRLQKEAFLGLFQRFVMALSQHISACEADGTDPASMWFACTLARLRQYGVMYHDSIKSFLSTLDMTIFTSSGNTDSRINEVFEAFKEL
jgi:nuclear cap-binding protein subunit 1